MIKKILFGTTCIIAGSVLSLTAFINANVKAGSMIEYMSKATKVDPLFSGSGHYDYQIASWNSDDGPNLRNLATFKLHMEHTLGNSLAKNSNGGLERDIDITNSWNKDKETYTVEEDISSYKFKWSYRDVNNEIHFGTTNLDKIYFVCTIQNNYRIIMDFAGEKEVPPGFNGWDIGCNNHSYIKGDSSIIIGTTPVDMFSNTGLSDGKDAILPRWGFSEQPSDVKADFLNNGVSSKDASKNNLTIGNYSYNQTYDDDEPGHTKGNDWNFFHHPQFNAGIELSNNIEFANMSSAKYCDATQIGTSNPYFLTTTNNGISPDLPQSEKNPARQDVKYSASNNLTPLQLHVNDPNDAYLKLFNAYLHTIYMYESAKLSVNQGTGSSWSTNTKIGTANNKPYLLSDLWGSMPDLLSRSAFLAPYTQISQIDHQYTSGLGFVNSIWSGLNIALGFVPEIGTGISALSSLVQMGVDAGCSSAFNPHTTDKDRNISNHTEIDYLDHVLDKVYTNSLAPSDPISVANRGASKPFKIVGYTISLDNWSSTMDWYNKAYFTGVVPTGHSHGRGYTNMNFKNCKFDITFDISYG